MHPDEIRNDLLALLMKGLLYHSMVCLFYNFASTKTLRMDLLLLLLYVPLLLFAAVRRTCRNFFVFLLFHILISGVFMLPFSEWEQRIVIGGCVCVMAVISVYARTVTGYEKEECPSLSSLAVFVAVFLAAWQSARMQVMRISCCEAFLFLVLYVIHRNLTNLDQFLNENKTMENFPKDQVKAINYLLLGVFVLFFMAGMLLLREPFRYLFLTIGAICRLLIRIIVNILAWFFQNDVRQQESFGQDSVREQTLALEAGEPSVLAQLLEEVFITGVGIVLAVVAVSMLARGLYRMYQKFYERHKEPGDESEFIWQKTQQKERLVKKLKKSTIVSLASPNQKIRRLYKKSIRNRFQAKEMIPTELTPTELESLAAQNAGQLPVVRTNTETEQSEENRRQIETVLRQKVALYEKARYSQYSCDKTEVEQMKEYIKQI